jgi:predicted porin
MKKTLVALAVLASLSGIAAAQSNVTVYGIVDAGVVHESGGKNGSVTRLGSGIASASRFGFRGNEDLGNGLSAVFTLEGAVKVDTGAGGTGLFDRQAFVGLKSTTLGTVTLGQQYTPFYLALSQVADPFGAGYSGSAKNLFPSVGANTRTSNTIVYASPTLSGFSADVAYSLGEQSSNESGRQIGAVLAYSNGPLNARLAYNTRNNDTALVPATGTFGSAGYVAAKVATSPGQSHNTLLAVNYDFIVAKAFLAYGENSGFASSVVPNSATPYGRAVTASTDNSNLLIGATVPVGPAGTVMASYIRKDDKNAANRDADQFAIGYSHALSKRTSAYATIAKINNKTGTNGAKASYTVGDSTEVGSGDRAISLGVRHIF